MNRVLPLVLAASLSACVSLAPTAPQATSAPAAATPRLTFNSGNQQLGTAQTRALGPFLQDERGQTPLYGTIGWVSLAPTIATVDPDGTVHALAAGSATIVAALAANPAVRASIPIQVVANTSTVQAVIVPAQADLAVGERVTLRGEVHLADGTVNGSLNWSSSDGTVLAVNPTTGEVSGLKEGKATIVGAYSQDQAVRATATIQVFKDAAAKPNATPSATVFRPGTGGNGFDGSDGWTRDTIVADALVGAFDFADPHVGVALAEGGRVFTSLNGGAAWEAQPSNGLAGVAPSAVEMVDGQTGFAAGGNQAFKTTDGGLSWSPLRSFLDPNDETGNTRAILTQLAFVNAASGYAVGNGVLFKTADGGATWAQVKTPVEATFDGLALVGAKPWLLGATGVWGYEGGAWTAGPVGLGKPARAGASFTSAQRGWAVADRGLLVTADGGRTWTLAPGTKPAGANAGAMIAFADDLHGLVATNNNAWTTADGGATWKPKDLGAYPVTRIQAAGPKDFFLLGQAPSSAGVPRSVMFHFDGR
ncbi:MAG: hypothetical protein JWM80_4230 [Cyanobacteria bacterium RYN_339]|nr:hypothetical protein [Cyanobacteria bacterium RYN_339]